MEGTIAPSPIHVRGLARRDLGGGWTAEVGLAVPLTGMILDPSLQVLGQIDRRPWLASAPRPPGGPRPLLELPAFYPANPYFSDATSGGSAARGNSADRTAQSSGKMRCCVVLSR